MSPSTPTPLVRDEELSERQRAFVGRLRVHDQRVKISRDGDRLTFHGPVIGEGLLPPAAPEVVEPDDEA
jgi:hypothetical protein